MLVLKYKLHSRNNGDISKRTIIEIERGFNNVSVVEYLKMIGKVLEDNEILLYTTDRFYL
jgi:hypothetical protein